MSQPKRKTRLREGARGRAARDVGGLDFGPMVARDAMIGTAIPQAATTAKPGKARARKAS